MSDDPGPLVRRGRERILARARDTLRPPPWLPWEPARVYGVRGVRHPSVALRTIRHVGPVRHALAQRAVCGVVEVHAPFSKDEKKTR